MEECMVQMGLAVYSTWPMAPSFIRSQEHHYQGGIGFDQDGYLHFKYNLPQAQNISRVYTPSGVLVRSYTPPPAGVVEGISIDRAGNKLICDRNYY